MTNKIDISCSLDGDSIKMYFRSIPLYSYFKKESEGTINGFYYKHPIFSFQTGLTHLDKQFITNENRLRTNGRPILTPILSKNLYSGFEFEMKDVMGLSEMKKYFKEFERDVKLFYNIFIKDNNPKDILMQDFLMWECKQCIEKYHKGRYDEVKWNYSSLLDYHNMFTQNGELGIIKTLTTLKNRMSNFKKDKRIFS